MPSPQNKRERDLLKENEKDSFSGHPRPLASIREKQRRRMRRVRHPYPGHWTGTLHFPTYLTYSPPGWWMSLTAFVGVETDSAGPSLVESGVLCTGGRVSTEA
jgi:hypothetical protein